MKKVFFYGIIFCLGFIISQNYGKELNNLANKSVKKINSFLDEDKFMKRAEKLGNKAKNSVNRFSKMLNYNKSVKNEKKASNKSKKLKAFYAYGTDSFDPNSNAVCYVIKIDRKRKTSHLSCHGKRKLQMQVSQQINNKIRRGEL